MGKRWERRSNDMGEWRREKWAGEEQRTNQDDLPANSDEGEKMRSHILHGLPHVLAEVAHPRLWLTFREISGAGVRQQGSQCVMDHSSCSKSKTTKCASINGSEPKFR
jgi:hypothetical protein